MDYSRYMFPPFAKSTLDELEKFEEFRFKSQDKAKVIDYMILMYDHNNTEFRRLHPDYYTRKREAALLAGFDIGSDGRFPEFVENLLVGMNDDFNTALVRYLMMQSLPDYPALVALKEMAAQELRAAFAPSDEKQSRVMRDNLEKITNDIATLEDRIYSGIETENVRKALYKFIETQRVKLRPEHIAEATKAGKLAEVLDIGVKRKPGRPRK